MPAPSESQHREASQDAPAATARAPWIYLIPAFVVATLCLPCLSLGYFWDDYYFLTFRGLGNPGVYLLPDTGAAFYRPVSQGLYFILLRAVDPSSGPLAHALNLAALAAAVVLVVSLVWRLSGPRAGFISGLVFASSASVPSLVAWVSCSQDLFAILFMLAAFLLRHDRKDALAVSCATVAVFCKEPALVALPVLALWDRLVGRPISRPRFQILAYGSVALLWALVHPGIRLLIESGFQSGAPGYMGIKHPELWLRHLSSSLLGLVNLPSPGLIPSWWGSRLAFGIAACAIAIGGVLFMDRRWPDEQSADRIPLKRIALIAALLTIPTVLAPVFLIRHWAPYFACIPAVGLAIFLGPFLARQRTTVTLVALAAFLLVGAWYRGIRTEREPVWTERVFVEASDAAKHVKADFFKLFPSLPRDSQILLSVASTGVRGIQSTMIEGQALQAWYRDPTIRTVPTLKRKPDGAPEALVRITNDLDVLSIDPESGRVQLVASKPPDISEIVRPIVAYARAVAAGGDIDRAVRITNGLAEADVGLRPYYHRMSAAFLLSVGRRDEAMQILSRSPAFTKDESLSLVKRLLAEPTDNARLDEASFEAFGLSGRDPETIRWIMREFRRTDAMAQAAWYAQRLQLLAPGDGESRQLLQATKRMGIEPSRLPT